MRDTLPKASFIGFTGTPIEKDDRSTPKVLGDDMLKTTARELVEAVRRNITIDWTVKESARAKLRTTIRRILRKYGYPPD